jgi:hypothetical protein
MPRPKNIAVDILLSLLIFTIPFNWFIKTGKAESYLRGIQIDYLLTKIYLQDFILFCLVIIILYSYKAQIVAKLNRQQLQRLRSASSNGAKRLFEDPKHLSQLGLNYSKQNTAQISFSALAILVSLRTLFTGQLNALMSLWQLASASGLAYYLFKRYSLDKLIWKPLVASAFLQSMLGIYQFIQQRSLVGYILFGEINLSMPGAIARESFFGTLHTLPYGTLPHPNVLAGFLGFAMVLIVARLRIMKPKGSFLNLYYILLGLFFSVILLTRSWLSISGVVLVILSMSIHSRIRMSLLLRLHAIITLAYVLLSTWFVYQTSFVSNNASIIRRAKLNIAGILALKDHLWLGTGINQSLIPMHTTYSLIAPADFIQPIHSIYLIWIVETGLIGAILLFVVLRSITKMRLCSVSVAHANQTKLQRNHLALWIYPLVFVLWLGLFDHYILTLRQGQLMAALAIALAFSSVKHIKNSFSA